MGFMDSVKTCFSKYVVFSGRASRSEYWWFQLFIILTAFILGFVEGILGVGGILSGLFSLAILLPAISVVVRRLHDTDRSGWWYWIALIPLIGTIVLIVFFCQRGTNGANRFGEDPFSGVAVDVFN